MILSPRNKFPFDAVEGGGGWSPQTQVCLVNVCHRLRTTKMKVRDNNNTVIYSTLGFVDNI